ncbi:hypothetical protein NCCP133_17140 [Cytobacillus sp. NCCP-133]|nr:hypothetical protein NCCP133_17140 [Cytobacillus sp. NCCP-133]
MQKLVIPFFLGTLLISGCSANGQGSEDSDLHKPKLEYKIGSNDWSAVTSLTNSTKVLEAYQFAVEHSEVLDYMPCYCGCYEEDGHISNTHCFVDSVAGDTAKLDSMGFG